MRKWYLFRIDPSVEKLVNHSYDVRILSGKYFVDQAP